ncbi:MAG TPA: secondary thiamine-phosphate synthase enzyme YjbQ [Bacteroidales bacterium]|nr:secondary thiamine-phosphate synthase enzyme YjbQ [Bacteroidales bacterium]HPF02339.1 secondary thiamine-phosphate synthase enzyme YjbQ [Bacteroidales bacterium]HPJ58185.1 secondary thiamine-phosphate synthase enzyme YjbQ [Bacteroidales bacterium]HPR11516.1 secondary thiamine-phosphate synthase enzyme YjbQ [Bacteroidales bacterium]HRW84258.1 secondary thiamine-phosphate synthase enzyme YjbQ [Bacteroidales bacterium]
MQKIITITTDRKNGLYDITEKVVEVIKESKTNTGIASVYARGSTAAIMIQENWDQSVQNDVVTLLNRVIPHGIWEHDNQDNNGDAHLKAGIVGASETIPVVNGAAGLSTWQNIFLCEFDGPRSRREVVVTVIGER